MADKKLFGNSEQLDDTISRRGTIVALKSGLLDEDGVHVWRDVRNTTINAAIEVVEAMPPAQPTDAEIQRMQDIEQAALEKAYECGKRDAMQWIPCKKRLPKEKDAGILKKLGTEKMSEYVLATVEVKGERMTVTACTHDGKWYWNMKYAFPDYKVVAWMSIPEPYQEKE